MFGVARRSPSRSDPRQPRLIVDLLDETEEPGESICRITGSLLSLLSDALSLFEAEYARRHR